MIIVKLRYQNGRLEPRAHMAVMNIMPHVVSLLWPEEYQFDDVEIIDAGYNISTMEDIVVAIGKPNTGQRFVGEWFVYPEAGNKGSIIEYFSFDKNEHVVKHLVDYIDRLTLF